MSDLARRTEPTPQTPSLTTDDIRQAVEKPLRLLPPEWAVPVWSFWAHYSHLLPNQLTLVMRLHYWVRHDDLTLEEAKRAFAHLCSPAECAKYRFAGELLAALAACLAELARRRKVRLSKSMSECVDGLVRRIGELPQ